MKSKFIVWGLLGLLVYSCKKETVAQIDPNSGTTRPTDTLQIKDFDYQQQMGCDGLIYPDPRASPYVVPFPPGTTFSTGLTNCSSSFHAPGTPDQYATDFDLPEGTIFTAARGGKVIKVKESAEGGWDGSGNYVYIAHGDNTFGLYYHSPRDGIFVQEGELIKRGQQLGKVGVTGSAGYPHLHFIVVNGDYTYPYTGIPVTFVNVEPTDVVLESYREYTACEY